MKYFIYYNPASGNILAISNQQDSVFGDAFIETNYETYQRFGSNEYKINEWAVLSNTADDKTVQLVKREQNANDIEIDTRIKKIKKTKNFLGKGIIIKQNLSEGTWQITYKSNNPIGSSITKEIHVIAEDNPHKLLDTFVIDFNVLLTKNTYNVKICNKSIAKRKDVSLICSRVDEEYIHIVS